MNNPIDPTLARQGRLGRQILVILVASLALTFVSGWILWSAVADETQSHLSASAPQSAAVEPMDAKTSGTLLAAE
tara:strand:- start:6839 stop:7063 length:225 start_codon:yes stop_codon:yes gene_type:complete